MHDHRFGQTPCSHSTWFPSFLPSSGPETFVLYPSAHTCCTSVASPVVLVCPRIFSQSQSAFQSTAVTCYGTSPPGDDDDQHCRPGSRFTFRAIRERIPNSVPCSPERDSAAGKSGVQKGRISLRSILVTTSLIFCLFLAIRSVRWMSGRKKSRKAGSTSSPGEPDKPHTDPRLFSCRSDRNQTSLLAFTIPQKWKPGTGVSIVATHIDSPNLRIRPISKRSNEGYLQVGVETYGGGIWHSWLDRDLSLAGRIVTADKNGSFASKLIKIDRPLLRIPTLAIHRT